MIIQSGSVTLQLDLNRLNGISSAAERTTTVRFVAAANSFFPVLIFNDQLRGPEPGSIALVPAAGVNAFGYNLPVSLGASLKQLIIEKLSSDQSFDLAVRDAKTGFTFFNIEGHQSITIPRRNRFPSPEAGCWFQKSLPTRRAGRQTSARQLEEFQ